MSENNHVKKLKTYLKKKGKMYFKNSKQNRENIGINRNAMRSSIEELIDKGILSLYARSTHGMVYQVKLKMLNNKT